MAVRTSTYPETVSWPVRGARAPVADRSPAAGAPGAGVLERSPTLLRRVNDVMREGRGAQPEPEWIPFFCECRRADCYEPVWLTPNAYDVRRAESQQPLVLLRHEHASGQGHWRRTSP